jgi:uncharacterized membrane protein
MPHRTDDEVHSPLFHPERAEGESSSTRRPPRNTPSLSTLKAVFAGVVLSFLTFARSNAVAGETGGAEPGVSSATLGPQSDGYSAVAATSDSSQTDIESHVPPTDTDHPLVGVHPELLNPERRILQVLILEGGVLGQSALVERTRWTDSTISRTLCRMETQERVERRQDGTGKLVLLPQNREN